MSETEYKKLRFEKSGTFEIVNAKSCDDQILCGGADIVVDNYNVSLCIREAKFTLDETKGGEYPFLYVPVQYSSSIVSGVLFTVTFFAKKENNKCVFVRRIICDDSLREFFSKHNISFAEPFATDKGHMEIYSLLKSISKSDDLHAVVKAAFDWRLEDARQRYGITGSSYCQPQNVFDVSIARDDVCTVDEIAF